MHERVRDVAETMEGEELLSNSQNSWDVLLEQVLSYPVTVFLVLLNRQLNAIVLLLDLLGCVVDCGLVCNIG